jgi:hypothetical protein
MNLRRTWERLCIEVLQAEPESGRPVGTGYVIVGFGTYLVYDIGGKAWHEGGPASLENDIIFTNTLMNNLTYRFRTMNTAARGEHDDEVFLFCLREIFSGNKCEKPDNELEIFHKLAFPLKFCIKKHHL